MEAFLPLLLETRTVFFFPVNRKIGFLMELIIFKPISITDMNLQKFLPFMMFIIQKKNKSNKGFDD